MMGVQSDQKDLFGYSGDLDKRIRADNPLRVITDHIDFTFERAEVKECYEYNGNESVDPAAIMKRMFLSPSTNLLNFVFSGWIYFRGWN
jgi:transposase